MPEQKELECPGCGALIDVSELEKYDICTCHECGRDFEYVGDSLGEA